MKKTRKTLIVSAVVLLGWVPVATIGANSAYTANAAIVGSSNNNGQKNNNQNIGQTNNQPGNNNNQNNNPSVNNNQPSNNQNVNNNQPTNNQNYNNNSQSNSGLTNIQELPSGSTVTLAGPSGFVYSLYTSSGSKASRGLAGDTAWITDKSATDSSGSTYYRVSTDEWVKASTGVTLN